MRRLRRVVFLDDSACRRVATGLARLPHDARDPRRDPEQVPEGLLELSSRLLHLLAPERLSGGTRARASSPSNDGDRRALEERARIGWRRWPRWSIKAPHERRSIATSTLPASAACGTGICVADSSAEPRDRIGGGSSTTGPAAASLQPSSRTVSGFGGGLDHRTATVSATGRDGAPAARLARRSRRSRRATTPAGVGSVSGSARADQARARATSRGDVVQRMSFCAASSSASTRASSPALNLSACARRRRVRVGRQVEQVVLAGGGLDEQAGSGSARAISPVTLRRS